MTRNPTRLAGCRALSLASLALLVAASAAASTLAVQSLNKNAGTYAARVGVASTCLADNHEVVTGTIAGGAFTACSTLTADADLASGATTFTAGDLVILRNGFSVATGAALTVEIDRALYPDAWVQDDTPNGETVYAARFYIDPSSLALDNGDQFLHFLAFDAGGQQRLRVVLKQVSTERRLVLEAIDDVGGVATTLDQLLLAGWNWVEVGWETSSGANDGRAFICLNAAAPPTGCVELANLDNDTGAIDFVRWGAIDVPSNSSLGNLDLDDFESRRSLNIGPLP
ncbi:MAG TPA: hypothetical protein VNB06_13935 [Thermoanaerobaculia bacterium]|nr:hypothetical protein [Thermoanaerobaculia bacterium]